MTLGNYKVLRSSSMSRSSLSRIFGLQKSLICTTTESSDATRNSVLGRWLKGWTASPPASPTVPGGPLPTALYWANRRSPNVEYTYREIQRLFREGTVRMWDPSTDRVLRVASKHDTLPSGARLLFPLPHLPASNPRAPRSTPRTVRNPLLSEKASTLRKTLERAVLLDMPEYFVLNKPAGIAVQRGSKVDISIDDVLPQLVDSKKSSDYSPAERWLARPRLVHRLDKYVTGALIVAKGADNAALLSKAFRMTMDTISIQKEYWAILCALPSPHPMFTTMLRPSTEFGVPVTIRSAQQGKDTTVAVTRVLHVKSSSTGQFFLVCLEPVTGKKHQLRIHCAKELRAPIVGDAKYGVVRSSYNQREFLKHFGKTKPLFLHCRTLVIRLPGQKSPVQVVAPFPDTWLQASTFLGWDLNKL